MHLFSLAFYLLFGIATSAHSPFPPPTPVAPCTTFAQNILASYNTSFVNAAWYAAGSHHVINTTSFNQYSFCEVNATVSYAGNNSLHFTVWLPDASQYRGSFVAVGNGGMAGTIDYSNMMNQLNSGFAVAGGDSGHQAINNNNGNGAPNTYIPYLHDINQVKAWIHDAISLFTPAAKHIIQTYYSKAAKYSYYNGCSTGGAQAFALAELHPELFDGIVAGSPAPWYSHLMLSTLWNTQVTNSTASFLSQSVLNFTTARVLDACDALDGVKDRLIEDPLRCEFDIDTLLCNASTTTTTTVNQTTCLTASQLAAVKAIYAGPPVSNITGELYPGLSFGSEIEWLGQENTLSDIFAIPVLQNLAFNDINFDFTDFDYGQQVVTVDQNAGMYIDEVSLNLTAFRRRGGKMLVTQGWSDQNLAALLPLQYLSGLQSFFNSDVSDFFNVFMIPGGGHCGAASFYPHVPATYHTMSTLADWVERGIKPQEMLSTTPPDGSVTTRKLCAWPKRAVYVQGDVDNWTSYTCEA